MSKIALIPFIVPLKNFVSGFRFIDQYGQLVRVEGNVTKFLKDLLSCDLRVLSGTGEPLGRTCGFFIKTPEGDVLLEGCQKIIPVIY